MGKFEGILICSDIDGTFSGAEDTISVNKKAVEYFTKEGGRFTFATGRNVAYLLNSELYNIINAPACLLNGSIIYDYKEEKIIYKKKLPFSVRDFVKNLSKYSNSDITVCVYNGCEDSDVLTFSFKNIPSAILDSVPLKIVCCFAVPEEADEFKKIVTKEKFFDGCYISKSWNVGVEFNSLSATKGNGIDFIKNYLKDIHTSIGIGDYENDIPLLLCADIGVCVGNGIDKVKEVADIVVKRNDDYAIADLIDILQKIMIA